jgi:hypothetical protein
VSICAAAGCAAGSSDTGHDAAAQRLALHAAWLLLNVLSPHTQVCDHQGGGGPLLPVLEDRGARAHAEKPVAKDQAQAQLRTGAPFVCVPQMAVWGCVCSV